MKFFKKEAIDFLEKLRDNNTKEWFLDHKDEYEELILEPSKKFVQEMGEELCVLVENIKAIPKINSSLFRIYRDIRLSKDKTPMKSRIGIIFWRGSGKRLQSASFYIHFSPDELLVACGIRGFSKDSLDGYREYIKCEKNAASLTKILDDIKSKGYNIPDPKYKRYPRGFDKDDEFSDLSLYASMFAYKSLDPKVIYSDSLIDTLYKIYSDLVPLFEWIYELSLTFEIKDSSGKSLSL